MHTPQGFGMVKRLTWLGIVIVTLLLGLALWLVKVESSAAAAAGAELQGLAPSADLLRLIRHTQEHRGLSAGLLGGNAQFQPRRTAKHQEVDADLRAALASSAPWPGAEMQQRQQGLQAQWQALADGVSRQALAPAESFRQHNALVRRQLLWLDEVVSASGLALDPAAFGQHLIGATLRDLPRANELLGQLRGRGAGILAKGEPAPEDRLFLSLTLEAAQRDFEQATLALERARRSDPASFAAIEGAGNAAGQAFAEAAALVQRIVAPAGQPPLGSSDYFAAMTRSIDAGYALNDAAFELLSAELQQRAQRQGALALGLSLLVLLAVALLAWQLVLMVGSIRGNSQALVAGAERMAAGDFVLPLQARGDDEFAQVTRAMESLRHQVAATLAGVRQGADALAVASAQIAQGNSDLSRRTEQQASALQQTASSMEELTGTVQHTAGNAASARAVAADARQAAAHGGEVVSRVVTTMDDIAGASRRIADIIGVIDGLAFQTNILALNAAVEAARAGDQGRGFAVVASEVRSLAQRSAEAAREIRAVITQSVDRVEAGTSLVGDAGRSIAGIVEQVDKVNALIAEIATAAQQQSAGIGQVGQAMTRMDQGTQQNAALVEQTAAAAASLQAQAAQLAQAVAAFKLQAA